jgi:hypothetical protein
MIFLTRRARGALLAWSSRAFLAFSPLAMTAFALVAPLSEAQAVFRQAPAGRIAIDIGAALTPSDRFSGFEDKSTGAFFALIELPTDAYDKLKTIPDSEEALANEGFSGMAKAELKGREGTYTYLVGKQKTPAGEVTKFVLIFTHSDMTGLVVANVPQPAIDAGTYNREGIEAILATAAVRPPAPPETAELFRFGYLGSFRQAFDHGGMTKAYNVSGAQPQPGENQLVKEPMLLVSSSIHGDAIDVKAQANDAFMQLGGMKERRIHESKEVAIGEFKGYRIIGEATDATSGSQIAIQVVLLSGVPAGYFMFLGSVPVADKEKMMPEIEKIIASFELVK